VCKGCVSFIDALFQRRLVGVAEGVYIDKLPADVLDFYLPRLTGRMLKVLPVGAQPAAAGASPRKLAIAREKMAATARSLYVGWC